MTNNPKFELPEPVENKDFYIGEIYEYTVSIDVCVEGLNESYSEASVCAEAIHKFRNGIIDGDSNVVHSEHVRDVKLCFDTDEPFDHAAWQKAKLLELGLNDKGKPLRPHEKCRPTSETTLIDFEVNGVYIDEIERRLCECGCNEKTGLENRFILGHGRISKNHTSEQGFTETTE